MGTATKMKLKNLKLKYLVLPLIILNIILASIWVMDGNIFFHTDIARDFLLMEDIVDNKNLTLIGPRSGAIPGLFHGPLWIYVNIPAYLLGGGDPVTVGWFWVFLYLLSIFSTHYVGKKMFGEWEGILAALLVSSVTILNIRALFNPYGAIILSPLYFYLFIKYMDNQNFKTLILTLFILGLIIQFQMAFGVPILILSVIYLMYHIFKIKKLLHLLSFLILLVPLSSYIIFDLRNNFLQVRSVIGYLIGEQSHGKLDISLIQLVILRAKESVLDGIGIITQNNIYLTLPLLAFLTFSIYMIFKSRDKQRIVYLLFILFFGGFWFLTIFFKGPIWNYYYLPFIPLLVLVFVSLKRQMHQTIFYLFFILIYLVNLQYALKDIGTYNSNPYDQDVSTWKFNKLVAEEVFNESGNEFGYFIFTPDLYGYSPHYAMDFYQKRYKNKGVYPYQKREITHLLIAPPPEYGKDPESIWYQKNINSTTWKINDVRISKNPQKVISYENGFSIEKYELSEEEMKVEPNQFLIKDIFFR